MTQRKLQYKELSSFNVPDGEILCAIRYKGEVYAGVRVGGSLAEHDSWIYGRYDTFKHSTYEGFWAYRSAPLEVIPTDMSLSGSTLVDEVLHHPTGNGVELSWDTFKIGALTNGTSSQPYFDIRIWRASDGVEVYSSLVAASAKSGQETLKVSHTLPDLDDGDYTVYNRVRVQRLYRGLPPDYEQKTGLKADDPELEWTDEQTGKVYKFDPINCVGALPYDPDHPLRVLYETGRLAGTLNKRPEWSDWFVELDSDGKEKLLYTEWAMLRLHIGSGDWLGESSVHPNAAPGPAFMKLVGNSLVPQPLRCSLRSVGALEQIDNDLFLGGMEAGSQGRYATVVQSAMLSDDQMPALSTTGVALRICECAASTETVHSITRYPDNAQGRIYASTSCDFFERVALSPEKYTLNGKEPGGRSLITIHPSSGRQWMVYAVEVDFAYNSKFWPSYAYVLYEGPEGTHVGPGVSFLYNSVLCEWQGQCWGITGADPSLWETDPDEALKYQCLCTYDGNSWKKVARWPKTRYSMGRLAGCGKQLLLFGMNESSKLPTAMRYDGELLYSNLKFPYYVERADTTLSEDGKHQTCMLSCRRHTSSSSENDVDPGYFLVETTGLLDQVSVSFPCVRDDEFGECDQWCLPKTVLDELEVDYQSMVGCYTWTGQCWKKVQCDTVTDEVWLEVVRGPSTVCFIRHGGPMPYPTTKYDSLVYTEGVSCIYPGTDADNAAEYWPNMPPGTKLHVVRYSLEENATLYKGSIFDRITEDLKEVCYFWRAVWLSTDPTAEIGLFDSETLSPENLGQLEKFDQPLDYGRVTTYDLPAKGYVTLAVFIPPTYEIDLEFYPL